MARLAKGLLMATGMAVCAPVFGAPVIPRNFAADDTATTLMATPVMIDVRTNDTILNLAPPMLVSVAPRYGKARIRGGHVEYTPRAGFQGTDVLTYSIGPGPRSKGKVTITVGTPVPLILSGTVTDAPIANAQVTASIGGRSYSTTADANGNYTLNVTGMGNEMVVLGARGGPAQAAVNFLSVLGQLDRLQVEAGVDGVLDRSENNQVQVTHVSTAEAFLLQASGSLGSDREIEAARDALDVDLLLQMAAAIKLVVDEGFPLPAGADDVLEMISDKDKLDQFIADAEANHPGKLDEATQATLADPTITPEATAADYVGNFTLINEIGAPGTIRVGIGQGERIELYADGTGIYLNTALNQDPSLTWVFADNKVTATFNNPASFLSYPTIAGYGQIPELLTQSKISLTRIVDGGGRDIFGVSYTSHYSYPENPELGEGDFVSTGSQLAISDEAAGNPFKGSEFPAMRTLPVVNPEHVNASGYALFDFAMDGTGLRDDGVAVTWTLDGDGRLLVEYLDGSSSLYTRLASDGRGADGLIAVHDWQGRGLAEWSISNVYDGSLSFSTNNLVGSWRGGFDISQASLDPSILGLYLVLGANGASVMASLNAAEPDTVYHTPQSWKYNADRETMESTVYYNDYGWTPECTPPVDGCYVNVRRAWHPISKSGNRIYVSEELSWDEDWAPGYELEIQHQRGNFYDLEEAPFEIVLP